MLEIKKKLIEARKVETTNNFFDLNNNGQLIVNDIQSSNLNKQPLQHDQLYYAMNEMSIPLIKSSLVDVIFSCEIPNVQPIISALDNTLFYYDMRQKLRKLLLEYNIPYFKTIKTLQLFKNQQKFFETYVLNFGNDSHHGNIYDCFLELNFLSRAPIQLTSAELIRFIKFCDFCLTVHHASPLLEYKVLSKILDNNITVRTLLDYETNDLLKLVENNEDSYIIILSTIKCMMALSNGNLEFKKDVISQLTTLKELLNYNGARCYNTNIDNNKNISNVVNNSHDENVNNRNNYDNEVNGSRDVIRIHDINNDINHNNHDNINEHKDVNENKLENQNINKNVKKNKY